MKQENRLKSHFLVSQPQPRIVIASVARQSQGDLNAWDCHATLAMTRWCLFAMRDW